MSDEKYIIPQQHLERIHILLNGFSYDEIVLESYKEHIHELAVIITSALTTYYTAFDEVSSYFPDVYNTEEILDILYSNNLYNLSIGPIRQLIMVKTDINYLTYSDENLQKFKDVHDGFEFLSGIFSANYITKVSNKESIYKFMDTLKSICGVHCNQYIPYKAFTLERFYDLMDKYIVPLINMSISNKWCTFYPHGEIDVIYTTSSYKIIDACLKKISNVINRYLIDDDPNQPYDYMVKEYEKALGAINLIKAYVSNYIEYNDIRNENDVDDPTPLPYRENLDEEETMNLYMQNTLPVEDDVIYNIDKSSFAVDIKHTLGITELLSILQYTRMIDEDSFEDHTKVTADLILPIINIFETNNVYMLSTKIPQYSAGDIKKIKTTCRILRVYASDMKDLIEDMKSYSKNNKDDKFVTYMYNKTYKALHDKINGYMGELKYHTGGYHVKVPIQGKNNIYDKIIKDINDELSSINRNAFNYKKLISIAKILGID